MPLISNCSIMPAWHQLVSMSGHVEESETARNLQLYATSIYQVHSFVCQLDYAACEGGQKVWRRKFSIAQPTPLKYFWTLPNVSWQIRPPWKTFLTKLTLVLFLFITLTLSRGWWGRCETNYLPKEEGREGGEKSARSAPVRPGARTRNLPRARRGSPAARQGGCLDKQAFPCL